ncbi:MAG: hypothetical protein JSW00_13930 [Thermoplasmata archaeon]|nr:MAG: hypothetical protein JSW00_13930 [Thermoplasmata archaeon]
MRIYRVSVLAIIAILMLSFYGLWLAPEELMVKAQGVITLEQEDVTYDDDSDVDIFEVFYKNDNGKDGSVFLILDDYQYTMYYSTGSPSSGQKFELNVDTSLIYGDSEFYFYANDTDGNYLYYYDPYGDPFLVSDYVNFIPNLYDPEVYSTGASYMFEVVYKDWNSDIGSVWLILEDDWSNIWEMETLDYDPYYGQTYSVYVPKSEVTYDTLFFFNATDEQGADRYLPELWEPSYVVRDYVANDPILSNPYVYSEGSDWIFNVTYRDPDGDIGTVWLYIVEDDDIVQMTSSDADPYKGMNYKIRISPSEMTIDEDTTFYLGADDGDEGLSLLSGTDDLPFKVGDFPEPGQPSDSDGDGLPDSWEQEHFGNLNQDANDDPDNDGKTNLQEYQAGSDPNKKEGGDGDDGGGFGLEAGWAEVLVGVAALVALAVGSTYGMMRKKKKQSRFSELLTELDKIYRDFKMYPHRCEIELEKMRAVTNEDLKRGIIDENNYSILKGRIDELIREVRSDAIQSEVKSEVKDLPKDIELRIKDMLIDGKISRDEYDKLLPIIKGSDMASDDKEKMEKKLESWVQDDQKQ